MGAPALLPIAIGAGVGALGSSLTGRNPIQGALLGGALGGIGGELIPAFQGAGQATATSASTAANAGGNYLASTEAPIGMFNTFNTATGNPLTNPAAQIVGSTGEIGPNLGLVNPMTAADYSPLMTRMGQGISEGGLAARNAAETTPSFFDGISDYFTPQNVIGAAALMNQQSAAPQMSSVGGGGVRGGNADVGETIQQFLQRLGARAQSPNRRQGLFY